MLGIGVLGELPEGVRTSVKTVTECGTVSTAPKEGFGALSMGEELVPSPPEDEGERSVLLSPVFLTMTSERWSSFGPLLGVYGLHSLVLVGVSFTFVVVFGADFCMFS